MVSVCVKTDLLFFSFLVWFCFHRALVLVLFCPVRFSLGSIITTSTVLTKSGLVVLLVSLLFPPKILCVYDSPTQDEGVKGKQWGTRVEAKRTIVLFLVAWLRGVWCGRARVEFAE